MRVMSRTVLDASETVRVAPEPPRHNLRKLILCWRSAYDVSAESALQQPRSIKASYSKGSVQPQNRETTLHQVFHRNCGTREATKESFNESRLRPHTDVAAAIVPAIWCGCRVRRWRVGIRGTRTRIIDSVPRRLSSRGNEPERIVRGFVNAKPLRAGWNSADQMLIGRCADDPVGGASAI